MKGTNYEAHYALFSKLPLDSYVQIFPWRRPRLETQTTSILFLLTEYETCFERMMIDSFSFLKKV